MVEKRGSVSIDNPHPTPPCGVISGKSPKERFSLIALGSRWSIIILWLHLPKCAISWGFRFC